MSAPSIGDPEYWRLRAEKMRTVADEINDPQAKQMMLNIANDYERLAERLAALAKRSLNRSPSISVV